MHKHPVPARIKYHVMEKMIEFGSDVDSATMNKMFKALEEGIKAANLHHDQMMESLNA